MRTVRHSVFETNSSSAHCVTFVTKSELDGFTDRDLVYDCYEGKLVPSENMYDLFVEYIEDDIKRYPDIGTRLRALIPTKEEYVKWVRGVENLPDAFKEYETEDLAVRRVRHEHWTVLEDDHFIVCGFCETESKQHGDEDLYALSMYRGE